MKKDDLRPGLTLIELAIGITIISIAFYALIAVFINVAPRTAFIETLDKKTFLAQEVMEEYLTRDFDGVNSVTAASFGGDFSNYWYEIVVTNVTSTELNIDAGVETNFKNVKVKVWGGPVNSGTIEIVSLMTTYEVVVI